MRAYWFARATSQAGVLVIPWEEGRRVSDLGWRWETWKEGAYQVQHLSGHDEGVQAVHDLLDAGLAVPLVRTFIRELQKRARR